MTGQAGGDAGLNGTSNLGVSINAGVQVASTGTGLNAASVTIEGIAGFGIVGCNGVNLIGSGALVTTSDGPIQIIGKGGVEGGAIAGSYGVNLTLGVQVRSTGTGGITLDGTGGQGPSDNYGVYATSGASITSSGTAGNAATITINGAGGPGKNNNHGVYVSGASVTSANGAIQITGCGAGTASVSARDRTTACMWLSPPR